MAIKPDRAPDWLLERLAVGELPAAKADDLRARLKEHGENERLSALAESNASILAVLPADGVVAEVRRRAAAQTSPRPSRNRFLRSWWALSMTTACATGIAMILALQHEDSGKNVGAVLPQGPEQIRYKGDPKPAVLRIYRKTREGTELLGPEARLHKGDQLQIRYLAAGKHFGVIASVDALGTVTFHLPETPGPAVALEREGERALAHAYELDASPGFERFFFITSEEPFSTRDVLPTLKHGTGLPQSFSFFDMTLKKDTP
jgi:hypothetical protein